MEFPSVPSPQERLKEISDAIQNTVVENLNSRDSPTQKNNLALPLTAGDDKTTRYFKQVTNSAGTVLTFHACVPHLCSVLISRTYVLNLCSEFMFWIYVLYSCSVRTRCACICVITTKLLIALLLLLVKSLLFDFLRLSCLMIQFQIIRIF